MIQVTWIPNQGPEKGKELHGLCEGEDYFVDWGNDPDDLVTLQYLRQQEKKGFGSLIEE